MLGQQSRLPIKCPHWWGSGFSISEAQFHSFHRVCLPLVSLKSHICLRPVSQVLSISVEDIGLGLISTKNVSFQVPTHLSLSIKCPLEAPSHKSPWLTHGPIGGQSSMVHSTSPVSLTPSSLDSTFCSVGVDRLFSIIVTPKGNR